MNSLLTFLFSENNTVSCLKRTNNYVLDNLPKKIFWSNLLTDLKVLVYEPNGKKKSHIDTMILLYHHREDCVCV